MDKSHLGTALSGKGDPGFKPIPKVGGGGMPAGWKIKFRLSYFLPEAPNFDTLRLKKDPNMSNFLFLDMFE